MIAKIKKLTEDFFPDIVQFRRKLHEYPELSFQEFKTTEFIKAEIAKLNLPLYTNYADTGVVTIIEGKNSVGPCVAIRADIDALPIQETTNLPYQSKIQGKMHACGHDMHAASVYGAMLILHHIKDDFQGKVKVIFQPGEEKLPGGASQMIQNGVLTDPKVDSIYGQHVFTDLPYGMVGFRPNLYMASADELHIHIKGKGGHAALSQNINDPIQGMNYLLIRLREEVLKAAKDIPTVIAFGDVQANGATNIIPDYVLVKGTFRTMDETWRNQAHELMLNVGYQIEKEFNLSIDLGLLKGYPCLINNEKLTNKSKDWALDYLGKDKVVDLPFRMSSEDFSYFTHHVPGCFYRFGVSNSAQDLSSPVHTSQFNPNEEALKTGAGLLSYLTFNELMIPL